MLVQRVDPGPTLKLPQGATATVHVTNHGDFEATVHWHGLRLETDSTARTTPSGDPVEAFTYRVHVPDPGAYWYHPHIREDYGQELGLYGNIGTGATGLEPATPGFGDRCSTN